MCMCVCHHEDLDVFARMVSVGFNEIWSTRSKESRSKGMASSGNPSELCLFGKIVLTNHASTFPI